MSGNFTAFNAINGQLSTVQGALATAAVGITLYLKKLALFSESATQEVIQLWLQPSGGTAALWRQLKLTQNQSADVLEGGESLTLASGDALLAATSLGPVDFTLTGVQET
jgi:hypothetical protein